MKQALKTARFATDDPMLHEEVLRKVATLLAEISFDSKPPEIAHDVHRIIRDVTGNPDPYLKVKEHDNRVALEMYPWMRETCAKTKDPLYAAIKYACAGNIIDYGVDHVYDLEETVRGVLNRDFAIDSFDDFRRDLKGAGNIVYLADNAGEIVFDRLLIEEMCRINAGARIKLIVKGGPILNDAMEADAKAAGLDGMVEIGFMGNGAKETGPERSDKGFLETLRNADLVLSKGQGNYEGLSAEDYVYFILMAKCPLIAVDIGVRQGDIVFCRGRGAR